MSKSWQTKSSKIVYENPWMLVREDQVVRPDGQDGIYGYAESKDESVLVVPIDDEGYTYLVQQERYTLKKNTWEFVAGRSDNDSLENAAQRELQEEIGFQAGSLVKLATLATAPGLSTFKSTIWLAKHLTKIGEGLDPNDGILALRKVSISELKNMITSGEIIATTSIAAFFLAMSYLEKGEE